jgi:hypothetical protein
MFDLLVHHPTKLQYEHSWVQIMLASSSNLTCRQDLSGGCISNDAHNGAHKNFKGNILISEMMGYAHVE